MESFKIGTVVYDYQGTMYKVIDHTTSNQLLCSKIYSLDGENYESSEVFIKKIEDMYFHPPVMAKETKIQELEEEIKMLEEKRNSLKRSIKDLSKKKEILENEIKTQEGLIMKKITNSEVDLIEMYENKLPLYTIKVTKVGNTSIESIVSIYDILSDY